MKVSVIIPNYNGAKYLKVCLDSLSRQTFAAFDIIVVDNGSIDDSCEYLEREYKSVRLIRLDKNYGFSKAVNEGIKVCDSDFVVLLNNDVEVDTDWLQSLMNCIGKDESIFSCSSKMIRYNDREKIDDAGDEYNILGWAYKRGDGKSISKFAQNDEIFSSCGGAAIYRKSVLEQIGYFDENFFAYMEDVDISYRAKIHGHKNIYCSDAVVYHIGSATSGSKYNSFKVKLAARNNVYVAYKNMPILQLLLNSPFMLLGFTIKYIFFCKLGFGREYRAGIREAFSNLKNVEKVKYSNKNMVNYVKIELEIIVNTFDYFFDKIGQFIGKLRG